MKQLSLPDKRECWRPNSSYESWGGGKTFGNKACHYYRGPLEFVRRNKFILDLNWLMIEISKCVLVRRKNLQLIFPP